MVLRPADDKMTLSIRPGSDCLGGSLRFFNLLWPKIGCVLKRCLEIEGGGGRVYTTSGLGPE